MLVNTAGVSPSQASIETILKVDLYGTAVLLEEVAGKIMQTAPLCLTQTAPFVSVELPPLLHSNCPPKIKIECSLRIVRVLVFCLKISKTSLWAIKNHHAKLRQVLRFYSQGKGTKTISSIVGISRNTVKKYLQIFHTLHMDFEDVVGLEDSRLGELFSLTPKPVVHDPRYTVLESLLPSYCKRLRHKGMSRRKLYKEYITEHPDGYSLASFDRFIQRHIGMSNPVMHLEHKAGDKLFIDFAGDKLSIVDADSGEILPVEVFVAILPCSQLTYVEAVMSQGKEDLITACENSLHYMGGTPLAIVPDNLKAAVTRSSRYEATLNDDFASFAEHYGCAVMPARAYKPRDKALVEGAVKLIYSSIYPHLEGRVFHDLPTLNAAIRVALEIHNNTPFVGRNYSRREQFEEIERPTLGKLNPIRYELRKSTVLTVMKNGHVRLSQDAHYYSVPCRYIGKKVKVIYTSTEVDIYSNYTCIASHKRSYARFKYTTV